MKDEGEIALSDGDIVIASITSCTNTSNPRAMIGAGILAKNACEKGLKVNTKKIKTSFSPGSRVVEKYLTESGLQRYLDKLGFNLTGYGCMTCGGKGGPLDPKIEKEIMERGLTVVSVTSMNRNFEARVHRLVKVNYITSPQMVVALALLGTVLKNPLTDPIGLTESGSPVYLRDIWPDDKEVDQVMSKFVNEESYRQVYEGIGSYSQLWNELAVQDGITFNWNPNSTYIKRSPFFDKQVEIDKSKPIIIKNARILLVLGDNISTDHICPEGPIPKESEAGKYLLSIGVPEKDLDTYGSRRGNPDVKVRGAFSNPRLKNKLVDVEGGYTKYFPTGETVTIYEAARRYKEIGSPLIIFAGKNYGMGSSRDWAAKGTALLGVRAVIAESFERIHRENLVCMGIVPLEFINNQEYETLKINPAREVSIELPENMGVNSLATLKYYDLESRERTIKLRIRLDTRKEIEYYLAGGIMPYLLNKLVDRFSGAPMKSDSH